MESRTSLLVSILLGIVAVAISGRAEELSPGVTDTRSDRPTIAYSGPASAWVQLAAESPISR